MPTYPRRVSTSALRYIGGTKSLRGTPFNYRLMSGQALIVIARANESVGR